jgi:hypothetical protein
MSPISRRPENKKARRIVRRYLVVALIAADEREDAETLAAAEKELESLDAQIDEALGMLPVHGLKAEEKPAKAAKQAKPAPKPAKAKKQAKGKPAAEPVETEVVLNLETAQIEERPIRRARKSA